MADLLWPILATVCSGTSILCLVGLALALMQLRQVQARPRSKLETYSIDRVAAEDAPDVVQRELRRGAVLVHTSTPQSGILNLHFVTRTD
jgi:hypothetical protein